MASLNYPESAEDKKLFDSQVQRIVDLLTIQEANQEAIRTVCSDLKDAYGSDPKLVKDLAKARKMGSSERLLASIESLQEVKDIFELTEEGEAE